MQSLMIEAYPAVRQGTMADRASSPIGMLSILIRSLTPQLTAGIALAIAAHAVRQTPADQKNSPTPELIG